MTISAVAATARAYPYNNNARSLTAIQWIGGKYRLMKSSTASIVRVTWFLPILRNAVEEIV
jgi:hypothetical protein